MPTINAKCVFTSTNYGLPLFPSQASHFAIASNWTDHGAAGKRISVEQKGNTQFHENLAECYQNTNRFEKAIEQLTILINEYDDKNPDWHYQIGRSYASLRDYEKAKRHYEIAIVLHSLIGWGTFIFLGLSLVIFVIFFLDINNIFSYFYIAFHSFVIGILPPQ